MKRSKIITYIIGIITFIIPIKLYFTPPTDFDGGPMMAYNFFFFYPLLIVSIILAIIVIFRLKYFGKKSSPKIPLLISILPTSILTISVLFNIARISNEPEILDLEIHNNTVNLKVNDTIKINLHGFTKRTLGENEEIIEVKILNLIPYLKGKYSFKDGGKFISENNNPEIFYKVENDSLIIYKFGFEYDFFNKTRIPMPYIIRNSENQKIRKNQLEENGFKKFNWE